MFNSKSLGSRDFEWEPPLLRLPPAAIRLADLRSSPPGIAYASGGIKEGELKPVKGHSNHCVID